ncbi:MAG: hypothetical protein OEL89_04090 [Candidatus Peregrinibacteria bacterium]|nr:hypothetical protein [Candidatus Peregrinibacteria bacterium]
MENTHIVINEDSVVLSPNLMVIFTFLMEIEKEVKSFLGFQEQLEEVREQVTELSGLIEFFAQKLKENDLDFTYQLSQSPKTIVDKLKFHRSPRSELIVLFAHLETLRVLWTAYENKTKNEAELRDASDGAIDKFLTDFCLCKKNEWFKKNSKRSISSQNLRDLRNSLTHFFSTKGLGVGTFFDEESERLRKKTNNKIKIIAPDDLLEIIGAASLLLIKKWSDDYQESLNENKSEFEKRIKCVKYLVETHGSKILRRTSSE